MNFKNHKLKLSEKIGYGFGDAASSMFWKLFGMYLMFFYTDIFGISAAVVGVMFLVTRVGDAFFDPMVGIMCDRTETRWGKFRPYLLWMAIPFGVIGVLTFTTPDFSMNGKIVYAYITYSLMMIIYSMINVPYASLLGVMTADGKERTSLATYRFIFAFGGSFLVLGLFQPLFDYFGTNDFRQFPEGKVVALTDTIQTISPEKVFVWNEAIEVPSDAKPVDSLLFLSARISTQSQNAFKIGLLNSQNNQLNWISFNASKDTLGLLRDGSRSNVQMKLADVLPAGESVNLADLKFVTNFDSSSDIKIDRISIREVNYQSGTKKAVVVIAFLAVFFFILTFLMTKEHIKPIKEKTSLKDDIADLLKNAPWFFLLGASISTIFFNTIRDAAAIYYFKYYFEGQGVLSLNSGNIMIVLSTLYLLLGQAANIVGVVLAKPVSDRIGKRNTFIIAMLTAAVLSILFFWSGKTSITLVMILQVLISINAGIIFPLVWSMFADTADYSEWKNGRRATGLVFSAASMSQKLGASFGIALVGWILAIYGYQANIIQSDGTLQGIRLMLSLYPAAAAFLSALFLFGYKLNGKYLDQISTELAEKRSTQK